MKAVGPVVTADGELSVLSVDMEATAVRDCLPHTDVRVSREFAHEAMDVLAHTLRDRGLERARVGVETDHLPASDLARLKELLPQVRFEPAQGIFNRLRMVKTAEELELLRRLSRITDQAIARALESVRSGGRGPAGGGQPGGQPPPRPRGHGAGGPGPERVPGLSDLADGEKLIVVP